MTCSRPSKHTQLYTSINPGVVQATPTIRNIMKQKEEEKKRVRRPYAAKGERSQKMMTFRVDNENLSWLEQQPNKGRYINELIEADKNLKSKGGA